MSKEEVYYEFIFPNYSSLSGTPGSSWPTSNNHIGEVRALCEMFPDKVITYDQLNTDHPISMYSTSWSDSDRNRIKDYLDQYKAIPKYFDLRNYFDADIYQSGGQSLMVSNSPELESTYIKFKNGSKTVYCSLMISSGDFFYSYNLPEEILEKSGLRDQIVSSKFHSNWYLKYTNGGLTDPNDEKSHFYYYSSTIGEPLNPYENAEKRVFARHYFLQGNVVPLGKKWENGSLVDLHYDQSDPEYSATDRRAYTNQYLTRNHIPCDTGDTIGLPYGINNAVPTRYSDLKEDLKKDFIDLEVTRRILYNYYNDWTDTIPTIEIPTIVSGFGYSTELSYDMPQEYINHPPMPIRYDLLRETLNDRDPYSDCETVLIMWVADGDPDTVAAGDIHGLRSLNWQQYAIPVSVRCCFKDTANNGKYSTHRFLINYPRRYLPDADGASDDGYVYRFHTRRNSKYNNTSFKESVYLQSLIEYSRNYILTYQNSSFTEQNYSDVFDIQKYLFSNCTHAAVYIRKQFCTNTNTQQNQCHYLLVNSDLYDINTSNSICIVEKNTSNTFTPTSHFTRENCNWGTIEPAWTYSFVNTYGNTVTRYSINDNRFIALFNINSLIHPVSGKLELHDSATLKAFLESKVPGDVGNWNDIYLSSIGISNLFNWATADSILSGIGSITEPCVPIGFLDGHIKIGNTVYGRNTGNGVVIGFKDVFDYSHNDLHHFHYNTLTDKYELVVDSNRQYTVYVMQYPIS